ncbi:MAG: hydroxyacylglutathione hydrolase [Planctomycetota bacterium]|jgi:hydroxyacylglutathione hydrolase
MEKIITISALGDNYIYLYQYQPGKVFAVDPGTAAPVIKALDNNGLKLTDILLTHHHYDHIGGIKKLKTRYNPRIIAPDARRISPLDFLVTEKDTVTIGRAEIKVMATPGHTATSVCFYLIPKEDEPGILWTVDTLFVAGCGRVFECTHEIMFNSIKKIAALPDETKIYPGHDYTEENYQFALTIKPNSREIRECLLDVQKTGNVNSTIEREKRTNLFLRAGTPAEFARLRKQKDRF